MCNTYSIFLQQFLELLLHFKSITKFLAADNDVEEAIQLSLVNCICWKMFGTKQTRVKYELVKPLQGNIRTCGVKFPSTFNSINKIIRINKELNLRINVFRLVLHLIRMQLLNRSF